MAIDFATLSISVKRDDVPKATAELERLALGAGHAEQATNRLAASSVAGTRGMGAWSAIQAEAEGRVGAHSLAIGRLERNMASVTGHALGLNSTMELLGATSLKFGVGDIYTIAIIGGMTAIVGIYELVTEGARKAKKQMDDMTDSLLKQAKAAHEATVAGREDLLLIAEINQQTIQKESGYGWRSALERTLLGTGARVSLNPIDADRQAGRVADAQTAVEHPRTNLNEALEEARKKELERLRKIDEERARQQRLLEAYNTMMEKAYGGVFAITPMNSAQRADWLTSQHGRTMSDRESAAVREQMGLGAFDSFGNVKSSPVSMPHVGLEDGLNEFQKRLAALLRPFDAMREAAVGLAEEEKRAKESLALTKEAWKHPIASAGAGAMGGVADALSQFTPQALTYQAVTSGINYIVSGFSEMAQGMFDGGSAAREAALAMKTMKDSFIAAVAAFKHDDLASALAQNTAAFDGLLKQLHDTTTVFDLLTKAGRDAYTQTAAQLAAEKLKNDAIIKRQVGYSQEDLIVRNMRALGQGDAADLLAFKESQQREMQKAIDSNKDQLYLNTLRTTENNELLAYLNGTLSTALRNAPTGFFGIGAYQSDYVSPRGPSYPTDPGPSGGQTINGRVTGGTTVINNILDGHVISRTVIKNIDLFASSTGGAGSSRSDALNRMPA